MAMWRGEQSALAFGDSMASSIPYMGSQVAPGDTLPGGWHPTVGYMLAFVIGELFAYHFLSKHLHII